MKISLAKCVLGVAFASSALVAVPLHLKSQAVAYQVNPALPLNIIDPNVANLDNGIKDLKNIYGAINKFRLDNDGRYPSEIINFVLHDPEVYGFRDTTEALSVFVNPDSKFSDSPIQRNNPEKAVVYYQTGTRFDDSLVGGSRKKGERDVLAYTDIYVHRYSQDSQGKKVENNTGAYLVLWDDGQIDTVPFDEVVFIPENTSYV